MDPITLIGILGALLIVIAANILEGGDPMSLLLFAPMLLVLGGTLLVSLAGSTLDDAKLIPGTLAKAFRGTSARPDDSIPLLVGLADKARREGVLSLEEGLRDVDDPYLRRGVAMVIDSTDEDEIREIMGASIAARRREIKQEAKFFDEAGAYAPTIGIIGTVMGLVHVLENLSEPEKLGHLIAGAFVATLWGVLSANIVFLPIASRIKRLGEIDLQNMQVTLEGVMAIQAGMNPRVVDAKLRSLIPERSQQPQDEAA